LAVLLTKRTAVDFRDTVESSDAQQDIKVR
jgi:hypothetical protein